MIEAEDTLTTREVARKLRASADTVRRMCEEGRFPGAHRLREGGRWRIPRADVEAFLERVRPVVVRRRRRRQ